MKVGIIDPKLAENNNKLVKIVGNGRKKQIRNVQKFRKSDKRILTKRQIAMVREVGQLLVTLPNKEAVAKALGITERALYKRFNNYPEIKEYAIAIQQESIEYAKRKLVDHAPQSADNVIALANEAQSENVKLEANLNVLGIAGIVKPTGNPNIQVNVQNNISKLNDDIILE